MRRKKRARNKKLMFAANMPPLYHTQPGQIYSQRNSDVLQWLAAKPMLLEYIFEQANNAKEIVYDSNTGKWQGVSFESDDD